MTETTKKNTRDPAAKVAKLEADLALAKRAAAEKELRENDAAYKELAAAKRALEKIQTRNGHHEFTAALGIIDGLMDSMAKAKQIVAESRK